MAAKSYSRSGQRGMLARPLGWMLLLKTRHMTWRSRWLGARMSSKASTIGITSASAKPLRMATVGSAYNDLWRSSINLAADIAKAALKDIIILLQAQVISNLKVQWQEDANVDFTALQDVSDSSQDKAILVLMQLQQRIITSGPIDNLRPPPLFAKPGLPKERSPMLQSRRTSVGAEAYNDHRSPSSSDRQGQPPHDGLVLLTQRNGMHNRSPSAQLDRRFSQQYSPVRAGAPSQQAPPVNKPDSIQRSMPVQAKTSHQRPNQGYVPDFFSGASPTSSDGSWTSPPAYQDHRVTAKVVKTITSSGNEKNEKTEKGHFASVTKLKLFGTRSKATPVTISKNEAPRIHELDASESAKPAIQSHQNDQPHNEPPGKPQRLIRYPAPPPTPSSRYSVASTTTASTPAGSIYEPPETPDFNPWIDRSLAVTPATSRTLNEPSRHSTPRSSGSVCRAPTQMTMSTSPRAPKEHLPSEENKFQGFCKGAWRAQIGDKKKAMDERLRPGGMYNAARFWQCSKCKFEGRLLMLDKKTKAVDRRVLTADGVQFRWDFLFKSHTERKDTTSDFLSATFGCIFCTAEGRGTPIFGGAQMLMAHLQEHREKLPSGEVLYRMNALVGPRAALNEDFDINIVAKEGIDV